MLSYHCHQLLVIANVHFAVETTPKSLWLNTTKVNCLLTEPT